ncbi:MAG: hypothetical protein AAGA27_01470 [Pseudomonadota bacterium]
MNQNVVLEGKVYKDGIFIQDKGNKACFRYNGQKNCFENAKIFPRPNKQINSNNASIHPISSLTTKLDICVPRSGVCFSPDYQGTVVMKDNASKLFYSLMAPTTSGGLSLLFQFQIDRICDTDDTTY